MAAEETRKGPWTEQEDLRLVFFVSLFGERRWDFIAKVSGLNRTGKSCRLRWVNYLHPGLKHGRMSPQEQRTVLELHSRWGNRWSRIARRLPGRTDNEIKNYWRTHMRKKAQEKKQKHPLSSSSSSSSLCHSPPPNTPSMDSNVDVGVEKEKLGRNGSSTSTLEAMQGEKKGEDGSVKGYYSMDQIWNEIASPEMTSCAFDEDFRDGGYSFTSPTMASPLWDYRYDPQWKVEDEDMKQWVPMGGLSVSNYQHERE